MKTHSVTPVPNSSDPLVRQILRQLDKLPLDDHSPQAELAAAHGLSEARFVSHFKAAAGVTPKRYFDRRRVDYCRRQLADADVPVKVVALDLGFQSLADFSNWTKKHLGAAPTKIRREAARRGR
ncbi:MAG: AraC family transcriptional regulator [Opitutaceae bacterium]|jgi:transcriptional regulator GlxA family with amidase domain|nr:AraC family transcriptional regulator [Opitutaceae bacterium]